MKQDNTQAVVSMEFYGSFDNITDIQFVMPLGVDKTPYQPLYDAFPAH